MTAGVRRPDSHAGAATRRAIARRSTSRVAATCDGFSIGGQRETATVLGVVQDTSARTDPGPAPGRASAGDPVATGPVTTGPVTTGPATGPGTVEHVTSETPTADLVAAAAGGDGTAWSELVNRYAGLVWSVARGFRLGPSDAADVSQSVWLRLVESLGSVRDPARLAGWLATTTRRESLRLLQRAGREHVDDQVVEAVVTTRGDAAAPPESHVLTAEGNRELWAAVRSLSERCRRLLRTYAYAPELSYAELAAALDMPVGSLGPTRGRCLEQLKTALSPHTPRHTDRGTP